MVFRLEITQKWHSPIDFVRVCWFSGPTLHTRKLKGVCATFRRIACVSFTTTT